MTKGTFQIISESYQNAISNLFEYCNQFHWIIRPIFFIYACAASLIMLVASLIFSILIIFDALARFVNSIRDAIFESMYNNSENVRYTLNGFIFNPIIVCLTVPIFILSIILPKISSELEFDESISDVIGNFNFANSGAFQKIIRISLYIISELLYFFHKSSVLFWPLLAIPFLFNSALMLFVILISTPLLILDLISWIVDGIRFACVKIAIGLSKSVNHGFSGFLFSPAILLILVPVFILVLIIPKFSSTIEGG